MKYIDVKLVKQLNDIAQEVGKEKQKCPLTNVFNRNRVCKKYSASVV